MFVRMSTYGVLFVAVQIMFVIAFFFYSLMDTSFNISFSQGSDVEQEDHSITMFKSNFQALTGMLAAGYYLHQLGLPIILDNKNQKNNSRDVF